jgi:DNA repair protein RecN (Recombination protein N)
MLERLYIQNFALVEKLEIDFSQGMSVLTGETGAGKSIIVGAIGKLLGEKADKDDIRAGTKLTVLECDFNISKLDDSTREEISEVLNETDIQDKSGRISLRREIHIDKPSRSFLNDQLIALNQLRRITDHLAELHGQHSHQRLLDEKNHLTFLDRHAGLTDDVNFLKTLYYQWDDTRKELSRLKSRKDMEQKERELLQFQKDEIRKANIRIGEEEELLAEKKVLDSSRTLAEKSSVILNLLDADEQSAMNLLGSCQKELSSMAALDKSLEKTEQLISQAVINLEEFRSELEAYQSSIADDPARQEEINYRLDELFRLKKKYGGSEEAILATLQEIEERLSAGINVDERIEYLEAQEKELMTKYSELALNISASRQKASKTLAAAVEKELEELGISAAKIKFDFIYEADENGVKLGSKRVRPAPEGLEDGRFLISANPGEPLKPLARTASGGEISRIMLAMKAADKEDISSTGSLLVFDEIDVGIGGMTANAVAGKLAALSKRYQLMVVTHLHQIAAMADHHYAVEKTAVKKSGRNIIEVRKLAKSERSAEIKRMVALPDKVKS